MDQSRQHLAELAGRFEHWMKASAWPLWWSAGRHPNGSFYEALDFSGQPVPERIARVRVQARQIYSFALAWNRGWRPDGLHEGLLESLARYTGTCLGPEGLPGMLVDIEAGRMTDPQPNLYVTAFTLLALAESHAAFGDPATGSRIERLLDDIDRHLAYPNGEGYRETLPFTPVRLQNPHMHFYESLLCLYEHSGDSHVGDRAEHLLEFVRTTFFDSENGIVLEEVGPDPQPGGSPEFEPGHSMEWIWLLGCRSRLFGVPLDEFALALYDSYLALGLPEGSTPMRLGVDHSPIDPTCRLWSQTEALKAHLCIAEHGPSERVPGAVERAVQCAESILDRWLDTDCAGGFYDQFDADGRLVARNIPGSMGYHLYVAVAELCRFSGRSAPG